LVLTPANTLLKNTMESRPDSCNLQIASDDAELVYRV